MPNVVNLLVNSGPIKAPQIELLGFLYKMERLGKTPAEVMILLIKILFMIQFHIHLVDDDDDDNHLVN